MSVVMKSIFILIVVSTISVVQGQSCNNGSTCVSIYECRNLLALVKKEGVLPADVARLRKAFCGFEGRIPKVCCPDFCYTPDGDPGNCVRIYSCPHIANMTLQQPQSKANRDFVRDSICIGPEQYSVCCGPPKVTNEVEVGNCHNRLSAFPPDPRSECCGIERGNSDKIIGGTAVGFDQYPWLVIIEYEKNNRIKLLCGGALISNRYVLTAAHCVTGQSLRETTLKNVRLGEYDTSNNGKDCVPAAGGGVECTDPVVIIPIELTIPHPDYNSRTNKNDIALIRLARMADFTEFIRPICLPTTDVTLSPPPKFMMWVAGWGTVNDTAHMSPVKLHVDLPYVSIQQCQLGYSATRYRAALWEKQLCAGGEKDRDSCRGDSGGPLMYENGRTYELVGIVSFGPTPCGVENIPGVYTKVFEYDTWIRNTIKDC